MKNRATSLKHRISRVMIKINYLSGLLMIIIFMFAINGLIHLVGTTITESLSRLMSYDMTNLYEITGEFEVPNYFSSFSLNADLRAEENIKMQNIMSGHKMMSSNEDLNDEAQMQLLEYRIYFGDEMITSTYNENSLFNDNSDMPNFIMDLFLIENEMPILGENMQPIGRTIIRLNPDMVALTYLFAIILSMVIMSILMMFSRITIYAMSGVVIKPITSLIQQMKIIGEGSESRDLLTEIKIKRPTIEVDQLIKSTNAIRQKMMGFVRDLEDQRDEVEAQRQELEAQNILLSENTDAINAMNGALMGRNMKMQMLMDNVDQGFFTLGASGLISDEYSKECEGLFGKPIGELKPSQIMFVDGDPQQQFVDELVQEIFSVQPQNQPIYIQLLPEEIYINAHYLNLKYKMVRNNLNEDTLLVVATCVTETKILEAQMENETIRLKMVVKALVNRNEIISLVKEYENFAFSLLDNRFKKNFEETLREIHTFKGSFSQYDMLETARQLNNLEETLSHIDFQTAGFDLREYRINNYIIDDMLTIKEYAGEGFFDDSQNFTVRKETIMELENKVKYLLPVQDSKNILPFIRNLRYTSLRNIMGTYTYYIDQLAQKLNKYMEPFIIQGDDILVDSEIYSSVIKSFVHLIRNAADHGIEGEDERVEMGKKANGRIFCHIHDMGANIEITIGDDGRGIDCESIKRKAKDLGLATEDQLENMSRDEILLFIFQDHFSTSSTANSISGRGVGLAAVQHEVDKLGGTIRVRTEDGQGTDFIITLPYLEKEGVVNQTSPEDLIDVILKATNIYVNENLGIEMIEHNRQLVNEITLKKISAIISIRGAVNALAVISINGKLADKILDAYLYEPVSMEEREGYYADVLGEITNTILGQAVGMIDENDGMLHIGVPAMMQNENIKIKYTQHDIHCAEFTSLDNDLMDVSLFPMDDVELEDDQIIEEVLNNG